MSPDFDEAKGKVEQAVGDLTDDDELKSEGRVDEWAGKAKNAAKDAADAVSDAAEDAVNKAKGLFKKD